jgi:hypothetical protein
LVVSTALHGSQDLFEVPPYTPALWAGGLGQPHRRENHQPLCRTPFHERYPWSQSGSARVLRDREEQGVCLTGIVSIALDDAIKRCVAVLVDFPSLHVGRIELGAIPKLPRAQILGDFADASPDVIPAEANRMSFRADTSQCDMDVRVLGVVVRRRNPFERRPKICFHL